MVSETTVREPVRAYVSRLVGDTREHARLGASPRGAIALVRASQARAVFEGRGYVLPDDVQMEARTVLSHRVRTDANVDGETVVERALEDVAVE